MSCWSVIDESDSASSRLWNLPSSLQHSYWDCLRLQLHGISLVARCAQVKSCQYYASWSWGFSKYPSCCLLRPLLPEPHFGHHQRWPARSLLSKPGCLQFTHWPLVHCQRSSRQSAAGFELILKFRISKTVQLHFIALLNCFLYSIFGPCLASSAYCLSRKSGRRFLGFQVDFSISWDQFADGCWSPWARRTYLMLDSPASSGPCLWKTPERWAVRSFDRFLDCAALSLLQIVSFLLRIGISLIIALWFPLII